MICVFKQCMWGRAHKSLMAKVDFLQEFLILRLFFCKHISRGAFQMFGVEGDRFWSARYPKVTGAMAGKGGGKGDFGGGTG